LAIWPEYAGAWCGLGTALLQQGQIDQAILHYQKALKFDPSLLEALNNLGFCYFKKGQIDDAIVQYRKVLGIQPDYPQALNNLGYCFLLEGQADDAIGLFQRLTGLKPDFAPAYNNLGNAWRRKGMASQAVKNFEKAIELQPNFVSAQKNLAWILATWPDASIRNGTRALTLASQADQLSGGQDPEVLRALAAAYAETGRFAEAVATAQKASALAKSDKELTAKLQADIKLYQNHFACRDD
jgi:Flp pilus assembly protein TadD